MSMQWFFLSGNFAQYLNHQINSIHGYNNNNKGIWLFPERNKWKNGNVRSHLVSRRKT